MTEKAQEPNTVQVWVTSRVTASIDLVQYLFCVNWERDVLYEVKSGEESGIFVMEVHNICIKVTHNYSSLEGEERGNSSSDGNSGKSQKIKWKEDGIC